MEKETTSESRRKFLKTAGKFAIYTPPALMLMSKANATDWAKTGGHVGHDGHNGDYKERYVTYFRRWIRNILKYFS